MNKPQSDNPYQELKALTRRRIRLIWELGRLGGALSDEDARLFNAMREHQEYAHLWGRLDELPDEEIERGGVNPIMHVIIHQTIENQIAGGEPAEVLQTIEALMQRGVSRHEAIHRVGAVLAEETRHILKEDRPFGARIRRRIRLLLTVHFLSRRTWAVMRRYPYVGQAPATSRMAALSSASSGTGGR